MSDDELQRRYHEGDPEALRLLWDRSANSLRSKADQLTSGNKSLAEKVLAELENQLASREKQQAYNPSERWESWALRVLKPATHDVYHHLPEEDLRRPFFEGDPRALDSLVRRYQEAFQQKAFIWAGGKDQNIADESLSRLYKILATPKKQQTYNPALPWKPWAFGVLRREVCNVLRDLDRNKMFSLKEQIEEAPDRSDGPSQVAERKELEAEREKLLAALRDCLQQLPQELRITLELRFWHEWTLKKIGEERGGVGTTAAYNRKARAQTLMRDCLAEKGIEGGLIP
jgi:RNA polymerase sigma factor (sigma-70 family)